MQDTRMMVTKLYTFVLLVVLQLIIPQVAFATMTCGESSPLLDEMGDAYFDVDVLPSKPDPTLAISPDQLFDALQTFSLEVGSGVHVVCTSSEGELVSNSTPVIVENIEIQILQGEVHLSALEVQSESGESHQEKFAISVESQHVTVVSEIELVEARRQRRTTGVGSHFHEISVSLRRVENGINVKQLLYVNGELAEWIDWVLEK